MYEHQSVPAPHSQAATHLKSQKKGQPEAQKKTQAQNRLQPAPAQVDKRQVSLRFFSFLLLAENAALHALASTQCTTPLSGEQASVAFWFERGLWHALSPSLSLFLSGSPSRSRPRGDQGKHYCD